MRHTDLKNLFKNHWQRKHPKGRIFDNNTGVAIHKGRPVPYGIPAPIITRGNAKKGGGGGDLIAGPGDGSIIVFEIKTLEYPDLSPNQIYAAKTFESIGWPVYVVSELDEWHQGVKWVVVRFADYIKKAP